MLAVAGFASPNAAAVAAGRPHMLRDIARGKTRTTRADSLAALADVLGQPMEAVAAALGLPNLPPPGDAANRPIIHIGPSAILTVRGTVQAGHWLETNGATQEEGAYGAPIVADPRFPPARQWLERVAGDSADRVFPEGTLLHVAAAREIGYAPRDGDFVVVERKRHGDLIERTLKQVSSKGGKVELSAPSHNSKWAAPLVLAADDEIVALVIGAYQRVRP